MPRAHLLAVAVLVVAALLAGPAVEAATVQAAIRRRCPQTARLLIHAATDRPLMEPLLRDFQAVHGEVAITFADMQTGEVYDSVVAVARTRRTSRSAPRSTCR